MAAAKKQAQDIDSKIAKLEAKINQLSAKLESKPTESPKSEPTKPAEVPQQAPPQEPPKPAEVEQTQQSTPSSDAGKSKKQLLEEYENDYLQRREQEKIEQAKAYQKMLEAEAKAKSSSNRGSLPKGFESTPEPEAPKSSKGTLPKGF